MSDFCPFTYTKRERGHPYVRRCIHPPGHSGEHYAIRPASHIVWEEAQRIPLPVRCVLVPQNGNWEDLAPENWQLVSLRRLRRDAAKRRLGTEKTCSECLSLLPLDAFEPKRSLCRTCYQMAERVEKQDRYKHTLENYCVTLAGKHFHMTDATTVLDYWLSQYLLDQRKAAWTPAAFRRSVRHLRGKLENAMVVAQEGKNARSRS